MNSARKESDGAPDGYYSLKRLTSYSGMSLRTLRTYLKDGAHPLPHFKVGGKILVKRSDFDAWITAFRYTHASRLDALVNELTQGR
jgi:excisionase family DNA binding protein